MMCFIKIFHFIHIYFIKCHVLNFGYMILFGIRFRSSGLVSGISEFRKIKSLDETTFGQFRFGLWAKRFGFARIILSSHNELIS